MASDGFFVGGARWALSSHAIVCYSTATERREGTATMESTGPVGSFQAQYSKFLSGDPNTIFQFIVFPDRVFMLKVGSALNQLPQILLHAAAGPVGLKDHTQGKM